MPHKVGLLEIVVQRFWRCNLGNAYIYWKMVLTCFKAYDIRGELGSELNEEIACRIGRAYGLYLKPKVVVLGGDVRETSTPLKAALANGLQDVGVDVIDLGLTGTEEIYFATSYLDVDGGIQVTASHNPINYNGMKLVRANGEPISMDSGLGEIKSIAESLAEGLAEENHLGPLTAQRGLLKQANLLPQYVDHLLTYIELKHLKPLRLVVNAGNGTAGPVVDRIEAVLAMLHIPLEFIKINHYPDATFPNGIPNPLLPENRTSTRDAVIRYGADMGIAWDGDFDRCFLFDETGQFIESYYIIGLLAETFLKKNPGEKIIHDTRLNWNTLDVVKKAGGIPIQNKAGHAFMKERMRTENAIYGGEMSAHHYFRDFSYCDSGMIPWLLVAELMSLQDKRLSALVAERISQYPSSGEINRTVQDSAACIASIEKYYAKEAISIDYTDGLSMEFGIWRFNLRSSNTEPLIRLNVESRANMSLVQIKTEELLKLISAF